MRVSVSVSVCLCLCLCLCLCVCLSICQSQTNTHTHARAPLFFSPLFFFLGFSRLLFSSLLFSSLSLQKGWSEEVPVPNKGVVTCRWLVGTAKELEGQHHDCCCPDCNSLHSRVHLLEPKNGALSNLTCCSLLIFLSVAVAVVATAAVTGLPPLSQLAWVVFACIFCLFYFFFLVLSAVQHEPLKREA